jgi:hypothetical protein
MHIHPTSVAYLQTLLEPYAKTIEPADLGGITQWIPQAFPGELGTHALAEMNKAKDKKIDELVDAHEAAKGVPPLDEEKANETVPEVIAAAKTALIDYLVAEILELAGNAAREQHEYTILPWDVQRAIGTDGDFTKMFGFTKEMKQLPVEVVVGAQKFTHQLTLETTMGLLLFSDPAVGKHDFKVAMFGVPFTTEYIVPPAATGQEPADQHVYKFDESRFYYDPAGSKQSFSVTVGKETYGFTSSDFMQGLATGAKWAGADHHQYWKSLQQHAYQGEQVTDTALAF